MNLAQSKQLLEEVSAVDNRKLTPEMVSAWHKIIGHVDYAVAERALLLARRDPQIAYLEPKHIIGKVRDATIELNDELRGRDPEEDWVGEPQPKCRAHNLDILMCMDCCRILSERGPRTSRDARHAWAVEHLYVQEPF